MESALEIRALIANELEPVYAWIEADPLFQKYRMSRMTIASALARAAIDPDSAVVGAWTPEGVLVGFAWFAKRGAFARSGYLRLIAVDPASRAAGIGRALMYYLENAYLRPNGILLLATDTNLEAHSFYQKLGYRKIGEIPDYVAPGLHEFIFHKPPPPNS